MADNLKKGKRLTLVMALDVDKACRKIQAKLIQQQIGTVSYSRVINDLLRKQLKL